MFIHPKSKKSKAGLLNQIETAAKDENKKEVKPAEVFKKFDSENGYVSNEKAKELAQAIWKIKPIKKHE